MQLFHSFNHSLTSTGTPVYRGIAGLLRVAAAHNSTKVSGGTNIDGFERYILTKELGARSIRRADSRYDAELINRVESLSAAMGIPPPRKILIYENPSPNAGVLLNGTMAFSSGFLNSKLSAKESDAIIAHELSHLKRYKSNLWLLAGAVAVDALVSLTTFAKVAKFRRSRGFWGNTKRAVIAAPLAWVAHRITDYLSAVVLSANVRRNETIADREAAELIGDPRAMASALEKMEQEQEILYKRFLTERAMSHNRNDNSVPSTMDEIKSGLKAPLTTHPPVRQRIIRLRDMEKERREFTGFRSRHKHDAATGERREYYPAV